MTIIGKHNKLGIRGIPRMSPARYHGAEAIVIIRQLLAHGKPPDNPPGQDDPIISHGFLQRMRSIVPQEH